MTSQLELIGRPHWSQRWAAGAGGSLIGAIGVASVAWRHNPWGLVFLVVGVWTLSELRRRVVVHDGELVAQGRVVRRRVRLVDLTQVAVSPMATVWVQPRSGRSFYLHMLSRIADGTDAGVWTFPMRLRELAVAHGAELNDWQPDETLQSPQDIHPAFSR